MENSDKARIGAARNLARKLLKQAGIKSAPVSLVTIIKELKKDHNLDIYSTSGFSDKLSGILVTLEDETQNSRRDEIHYNENHSWVRRRFTIAHEIGHLLFNTSCKSGLADYYDESSVFETEANAFASELLMPHEFLKRDLKGKKIDDVAFEYIVSKEALGWKVSKTNLLNYL